MTKSVAVTLGGATIVKVTVGGVYEDKIENIEDVSGGHAADRLTGDGAGCFALAVVSPIDQP